ncbi:MAG: hypothetical protein IIA72_16385 [Proteobacteria bacterium]|nr:hypothetical protein [Pseudomonadota bacterium]
MATIFAMVAIAIFGVLGASLVNGLAAPAVIAWAIVNGGLLVVAAMLCMQAAWPRQVYVAGNEPQGWWGDDVENRPLAECLRKESLNYDAFIKRNRTVITSNNNLLRRGARVGYLSPVAGLIAGVLAWAL